MAFLELIQLSHANVILPARHTTIVALISFRPVILAKDVVLLVMIASGLASAPASAHLTKIAVQTIQRFALRV